jgi:hypothetical protein
MDIFGDTMTLTSLPDDLERLTLRVDTGRSFFFSVALSVTPTKKACPENRASL